MLTLSGAGVAHSGAANATTSFRGGYGPLLVGKEGSFFVGGKNKAITGGDSITVDQMYVQYQIPVKAKAKPAVIMIHGCCLSAKSWEETPDGRMGWNEYFLRNNFPTYLIDQASRARSGFDPTDIEAVKAGTEPTSALPTILTIGHDAAWTAFRFGPTPGQTFPGEQFPVQAIDQFYDEMIPDLNLMFGPYSGPNPTYPDLAETAKKAGGAVLIGHSESGFFPQDAALSDPTAIKGMVTLEPGGSCTTGNPGNVPLTDEQIHKLAKIPTLVVFGDNLSGSWVDSYNNCHDAYYKKILAAGGDITFIHLPDIGIHGNSHMMMLDENNLQVANVVTDWIDKHVH